MRLLKEKMARKLPETISEEELLDILKKVDNPKIKLSFMLGFYGGLRVSEVTKLMPEDIDFRQGFIHIREGKGKKDRDVPIPKPIVRGLRHLPIGKSVRTLQRQIKQYAKQVLNKDIHFHCLRHSCGTWLLNKHKKDIRFIQQYLGHSNISSTQIYTHINNDVLKEGMDDIWGESK